MRWTRTILTGAAVAGGTALVAVGLAHAQGHGGWGPRHGRGMIVLIEQFDLDKDGKLTQAEIDQARKDQFAKYDTDQNGTLSLQEYQSLWLDAMRRAMVRQFQANDTDGDAAITVTEFTARFDDLVADFDRNGDGVLTRDELRPRGPHGRRGAGPMGPGGHPPGPPPDGPDGPGPDDDE